MDGDADVVDRLARDLQRFQALRDYGDRLDVTTIRFHLHPITRFDPELARESLADLDELLRLQDGVEPAMLGPEVEMLGEPIGGTDVGESVRFAERLAIVLEHASRGIIQRERLL